MSRREYELKVWPPFFDALADGSKTFEVRKDDRGIQPGDLLRLREWQPFDNGAVFSVNVGDYTGREVAFRVGYVLRDEDAHEFGVRPGYCVLALLHAYAPALLAAAPAPTEHQHRFSFGLCMEQGCAARSDAAPAPTEAGGE